MHTLKDVYYAEKQLYKALPNLAKKSSDKTLQKGFKEHEKQTETHIDRLE